MIDRYDATGRLLSEPEDDEPPARLRCRRCGAFISWFPAVRLVSGCDGSATPEPDYSWPCKRCGEEAGEA